MGQKVGVICKSCGERIPIEDEYVAGLRALPLARSLYLPGAERVSDSATEAWQRSLRCGNLECRQTHDYIGGDLVLYNE